MDREHCLADDSQVMFNALNFSTQTTSEVEWYFVTDPEHPPASLDSILRSSKDGGEKIVWPQEDPDCPFERRVPQPLS
eukprot:2251036-Prymnesium_polylepis.1